MYILKGYITNSDTSEQKHVSVIVEATSCSDAITIAAERFEITDVTAVALSPIKEIIHAGDAETDFFVATAQEHGAKPLKYQLLTVADSFETARSVLIDTLSQGYGMELVALKKIKLHGIAE